MNFWDPSCPEKAEATEKVLRIICSENYRYSRYSMVDFLYIASELIDVSIRPSKANSNCIFLSVVMSSSLSNAEWCFEKSLTLLPLLISTWTSNWIWSGFFARKNAFQASNKRQVQRLPCQSWWSIDLFPHSRQDWSTMLTKQRDTPCRPGPRQHSEKPNLFI